MQPKLDFIRLKIPILLLQIFEKPNTTNLNPGSGISNPCPAGYFLVIIYEDFSGLWSDTTQGVAVFLAVKYCALGTTTTSLTSMVCLKGYCIVGDHIY